MARCISVEWPGRQGDNFSILGIGGVCACVTLRLDGNLVPRVCIPFGQHQGCKTSGIINVKMLANRNLIGYYILPEVYEKEVSKQEIKILRMLLLDVFDHVRDGQWERNLKMGDAN